MGHHCHTCGKPHHDDESESRLTHAFMHSTVQALHLIITKLTTNHTEEMTKLTDLEDKVAALEAEVTAENTVIDSAEALLTNINQLLQEALAGGGSPTAVVARVQAVVDSMTAKTAELSAAVAANTPSAPPPTP